MLTGPARPLGAMVAGVAVAGLALTGCGSSSSGRAAGGAPAGGSPGGRTVVVDRRPVGQLGPVLVTSDGRTLYMFPPDAERHVTCGAICAATWPPLTTADGKPEAGPGVQQSLLGRDPDPSGGPAVVTYDGWPLYTYQDDLEAGQASGQGIDLDGGYWYVMAPSGQPITVGSG